MSGTLLIVIVCIVIGIGITLFLVDRLVKPKAPEGGSGTDSSQTDRPSKKIVMVNSRAFGYLGQKGRKHSYQQKLEKYQNLPTEHKLSESEMVALVHAFIASGALVFWVRVGSRPSHLWTTEDTTSSDVVVFFRVGFGLINRPFILLSSDGDAEMPAPAMLSYLTNPKTKSSFLLKWYAQNCVLPGMEKIQPLPIGLDLHPSERAATFIGISRAAKPWKLRKKLCFVDADPRSRITHPDRQLVITALPAKITRKYKRLGYQDAMKYYSEFRFGISLRGNGWDCHRTWELIGLGVIPILLSGPLDSFFRGKVQCILLSKWEEIEDENIWTSFDTTLPPNSVRTLQVKSWIPELNP